ncbi:MAG: protein-glutamate O-methyltransferase CheR [Giesbergeria sp.]|uniref:CheR family methyltransferase n=1 Tax=Giesbergeria sp. TaxID=2818473 RepID=UPI00262D980F|nr:protein-glutamate O-methyltransferase CheR [Giesbergeria sp.]MDD2608404.1 protein-glutamate O-methyltransferase CheR [Giesbergeria sp.]
MLIKYKEWDGNAPAGLILSDHDFNQFRHWIFEISGISMGPSKKALVAGRLARRVQHHGLRSFHAYFEHLHRDTAEHQIAIDLLTTNETHFFREPRHFELLRDVVLPGHTGAHPLRIWSAASSTGQEAYSIAMLLAHTLGQTPWEVFGSDLSTRVLEQACSALYDIAMAREIPEDFLRKFCLKGVGAQAGRFLIAPEVTAHVYFSQINLNQELPNVGDFDVIFLRNVLIYFNEETKRGVIDRLQKKLRPGGWFFVGHSESLNGVNPALESYGYSVYRKRVPGAPPAPPPKRRHT